MPNERIIAKETEKNKRCTRCCSNDGSSASLAPIASYSPLNARLDALLSSVSYRSNVLELLHIETQLRSKVKQCGRGQYKLSCVQQRKQGLAIKSLSFARPSMLNIGSMS